MKVQRNFAKLFVLVLAATALSVGTGYAQGFQGKFTLTSPALWGHAVLQPGNYTLAVTRGQNGEQMVTVRGEGQASSAAIIFPASRDTSAAIGENDLVCIRQGGELVVRTLDLSATGESYRFEMPKAAQLYALARPSIERVPVAVSGK
jgi:hypothetical protein